MQILSNRRSIGTFLSLISLVFFNNLPSHAQQVSKKSTWQQQCDYDIEIKLDDVKRQLTGKIKMTYTNNSPETLREIYIHLWPNAYMNNETPFAKQQVENGSLDFYFTNDSCRGNIDSLSFWVNGIAASIKADFNSSNGGSLQHQKNLSIDIICLILPMPLAPGDVCTIETPFRVQIPKVFSRLGWGYDKETENYNFNITQWYPKPAVYDATGWNAMPYLDQGEFYSEFGTFNVKITVPTKYIVAATGNEQSKTDNADGTTTSKYNQSKVHDFAWFVNPDFRIVSEDIILKSGRKIVSKVYYIAKAKKITDKDAFDKTKSYSRALNTIKNTVEFLGTHVGEYPYDVVTVVQGPLLAGGGMEYPTITVMPTLDATTIEHEVGHNWFYGILGSNEREHPWMDEGINSFYEDWYKNRLDSNNAVKTYAGVKELSDIDQHYILYQMQQFAGVDQPVEGHSADYSDANYGAIVYGKTALVFNYLREYLGNEMMDKCMREYYNTWKFKHPLPGDIREVFERVSGKKLDWFFNTLIGTTKTVDYKLVKAKQLQDKLYITIKNKGGVESPVFINTKTKTGDEKAYAFEGFKGKKTFEVPCKDWKWVKMDTGHYMMETNLRNNYIKRGFLFKGRESYHIKLGGIGQSNDHNIYVDPMIGINKYDGFMLGCMISNEILPLRSLQYTFITMYGFKSQRMAGMGDITKFIKTGKKKIYMVEVGVNFRQFSNGYYSAFRMQPIPYYNRTDLYINLLFGKKDPRSLRDNSLKLGVIGINENYQLWQPISLPQNYATYPYLEFNSKDNSKLNPISYQVKAFTGNTRRLQATASGHFNSNIKKKLYYRFFGGIVKSNSTYLGDRSNIYASGNSGMQDFTYDHLMPGRNEQVYGNNIWSQQVLTRDGNMHIPMAGNFMSSSWLTAANFELPLPGKIPFRIYADVSVYNGLNLSTKTVAVTSLYCAGISLPIIDKGLTIYIPLLYSKSMHDFYKLNPSIYKSFFSTICFNLDLNRINPTHRKNIRINNFM